MSRVGKKPIPIPSGVSVELAGRPGHGQGPPAASWPPGRCPGSRSTSIETEVRVRQTSTRAPPAAFHGLSRALMHNLVEGVSEGFPKGLEIVGTGYRASLSGRTLTLALGFSHPIEFPLPDGIDAKVETPTRIVITRNRQGAGRSGGGRNPQSPAARALQGQGDPVRGRTRPAQGRQVGRRVTRRLGGRHENGHRTTDGVRRGVRRHRRIRQAS